MSSRRRAWNGSVAGALAITADKVNNPAARRRNDNKNKNTGVFGTNRIKGASSGVSLSLPSNLEFRNDERVEAHKLVLEY